MWRWLAGDWRTAGFVAVSTVLIYLSTVAGAHVTERRTLAEMSAFDFIVAVALGAIVGRTATTPSPSYVQGTVAVATLVGTHRFFAWARLRSRRVRRLVDRAPEILLASGRPVQEAMERARVTEEDLFAVLREHGVRRIEDVELVVLEARGRISVVPCGDAPLDERLLRNVTPAPRR